MIRAPPESTRSYPLFPDPSLCLSSDDHGPPGAPHLPQRLNTGLQLRVPRLPRDRHLLPPLRPLRDARQGPPRPRHVARLLAPPPQRRRRRRGRHPGGLPLPGPRPPDRPPPPPRPPQHPPPPHPPPTP